MAINEVLERVQRSAFRSRFHLGEADRQYIAQKGLPQIRQHARDFVHKRLSLTFVPNDGKQTPMKGHTALVHTALLRVFCKMSLTD